MVWLLPSVLTACELLALTETSPANVLNDFQIVWVQTVPPVATPGSLFFIDAAIANPELETLRVFAFTCLPDRQACDSPLGLLVTELFLRCEDGGEPPCIALEATAGLQLSEALVAALPRNESASTDVELPLFVAACIQGTCPRSLTNPMMSPVIALGLEGTSPPVEEIDPAAFRLAVRPVLAKPTPEPGDSNPELAPLTLVEEPSTKPLAAGESVELTFRIEGGGRGAGNIVSGFTTGGSFTTGSGFFERVNVRRDDVFRFRFTMPRPATATSVWVVLDENGSSAGDAWSATFPPAP
ncbi:MAG: hypothetical protein AAGA48_26435 [Myxococcota bacterium]